MTPNQAEILIDLLKKQSVSFDKGLTDEEIKKAETQFAVLFPPDLKLFLQTALPINNGFTHWRFAINGKRGADAVRKQLNWPLEGCIFDIKHNKFWKEDWGEKPNSYEAQCEIAKAAFKAAPTLIPIAGHRYIPEVPHEIGNPVFSVYQTDIIYYGLDLASYLANEHRFVLPANFPTLKKSKPIIFWDDFIWLDYDS